MLHLLQEYYPIPSKRFVDDLIEREGAPSEDSWTPFMGCNHLIREQFQGSLYGNVSLDFIKQHIFNGSGDIDLDKVRLDSKLDNGMERDVTRGLQRFEDLDDDEKIWATVESQLIGIKTQYNGDGYKGIVEASRVQTAYYDDEDGAYTVSSSLELKDKSESGNGLMYQRDEEKVLLEKIPYLLKVLEQGSRECGVCLIDLVANRAYALDHVVDPQTNKLKYKDDRDAYIKFNYLRHFPVRHVDYERGIEKESHIYDLNDPNTNSNSKFRAARMLIDGSEKDNKYYKAGMELIDTMNKLDLPLYKEDLSELNSLYIKNLVNTYIESNIVYIEDLGIKADINVLNSLRGVSIAKSAPVYKKGFDHLRLMAQTIINAYTSTMDELPKVQDCNNYSEFLNRVIQNWSIRGNAHAQDQEELLNAVVNETGVLVNPFGDILIFRSEEVDVTEFPVTGGYKHAWFFFWRGYMISIQPIDAPVINLYDARDKVMGIAAEYRF